MIYVVLPNLNVSGGIKVGCQWVRALIEEGYSAVVVVPQPQDCPEWLGFKVPVLGYLDFQDDPGNIVVHNWLDQILELTVKNAKGFYFAQDVAQPLYVETYHERFVREYLPILRGLQLLTVSHATRRWYLHRYGLQSQVISNWVDRSVFYPNGNPSFDVVMVRHRDHFREDVLACLEGAGYKVLVAEGHQREVANKLRQGAVFVSCARGRPDGYEMSEGLPMPVMEAMACGCVPVCPDTNGVRDLIIPGLNGYLIPNDGDLSPADYLRGVESLPLLSLSRMRCSASEVIEWSFNRKIGVTKMLRALKLAIV